MQHILVGWLLAGLEGLLHQAVESLKLLSIASRLPNNVFLNCAGWLLLGS